MALGASDDPGMGKRQMREKRLPATTPVPAGKVDAAIAQPSGKKRSISGYTFRATLLGFAFYARSLARATCAGDAVRCQMIQAYG